MDSEHDDSVDKASAPSGVGAGAQLRSARQAQERELEQVAAETRIPLRHLEAIESGNFEMLPSRAYAIGFSRTFAKAVGLDAGMITDVVRAELADGAMRRTLPAAGMEPGDPARLPSAGLAWFGAFAALVLAVGAFVFSNSYFGAGTEPGSSPLPAPSAQPAPSAPLSPLAPAPGTGGEVVLTALEDDVWLRLYEQGGDRLFERTLKQGETVTVPATAADPRINIGRPHALGITVNGNPVAKLAGRAMTLADAQVSAAALLARVAPAAGAADASTNSAIAPSPRPAARRTAAAIPSRSGTRAAETVLDATPESIAASASAALSENPDSSGSGADPRD